MGLFKKVILIFSLVSIATVAGAKPSMLIVGGEPADKGEFPFIASLHDGGHFCGGTLIAKRWVLTAGHCVTGIRVGKVYVGLHDQNKVSDAESFNVKRVIRHPDYNDYVIDYDYALIELDHDATIAPIPLNEEELEVPSGNPQQTPEYLAETIGWGLTSEVQQNDLPDILQKVVVPLVSRDQCEASYPGAITDRMICAGYDYGGRDACAGDSGGPLLGTNDDGTLKIIGVVSWGQGCAQPKYYGVYSKVSAVIDWIHDTIN